MKPGPWLKDALEVIMTWQLANPDVKDTQAAMEAVSNMHREETDNPRKRRLNGIQGTQKSDELHRRLVNHIITLIIRPLFAQTKFQHSGNITAVGNRKQAAYETQSNSVETEAEEAAARPWKNPNEAYALDLLEWAVGSLDTQLVQRYWGLLVPTILALIDDVDVHFKARGCKFLHSLLQKTEPSLLKRTGLGEVFEQALTPCLSYLPTLTSEADSEHLLLEAYPSLFKLMEVRYSSTDSKAFITGERDPARSKEYVENMSAILHSHVLPSLSHISGSYGGTSVFDTAYPRVTSALLRELDSIINLLAGDAIGQLVYLVPLVSSILENPFAATLAPGIVVAATSVFTSLIVNAWPRVWRWRMEIMRGLGSAYIGLVKAGQDPGATPDKDSKEQQDHAKAGLIACAKALYSAVATMAKDGSLGDDPEVQPGNDSKGADGGRESRKVDFKSEMLALYEADNRLEPVTTGVI